MLADTMVLELVEARLKPSVPKEEFLKKSKSMHESFLKGRVGFLRRSVWLSDDGRCGAILTWRSKPDALEAMRVAFENESVRDFAACFVEGSYAMSLVPLVEDNIDS